MEKLSTYQTELLRYFAEGGVVEFCTSVGGQLGATAFPKAKPDRFNKLVMNSLLKYGLLKPAAEKFVYGLRWSRIEVSNKGIELVASWEGSNETV